MGLHHDNHHNSNDDIMKIAIYTASIIACLAALYPIITFITFSSMRQKRFMKFIFYISTCDFFVGVASLFGFPRSNTMLCTAQGILTIYFSTASWFWTTCLSYCMYSITSKGHSKTPDWQLHVICWGLPVLLSFLPLSNTTYGQAAGGNQWCVIVNTSTSPPYAAEMWSYLAYFGWLFLCFLLMTIWYIRVRGRIYGKSDSLSALVRITYEKISWYPIAMLCSWMLNFICIEFSSISNGFMASLSILFGVSYGTFTALVFFIKSDESRGRWHEAIITLRCCQFGANARQSTSSIPIDFVDDDKSNPFVVSDIVTGDSKSIHTITNTNGSGVENESAASSPGSVLSDTSSPLANYQVSKSTLTKTPLPMVGIPGPSESNSTNKPSSSKRGMTPSALGAGMSSAVHSESSHWTGSSVFTMNSERYSTAESSADVIFDDF